MTKCLMKIITLGLTINYFRTTSKVSYKKLNSLQHATDRAQLSLGMTFNVYNDNQGVERILHLDIIPRIIDNSEWTYLEKACNNVLEH
jgi:uncharacterized circularly permuted ATP-grasp superfamily protein